METIVAVGLFVVVFIVLANIFGGNDRSNDSQKTQNEAVESREADDAIEKIIRSYGKLMEENPPLPRMVYDTKNLPYPKDTIRKAILTATKAIKDEHGKGLLKDAYITLAQYQEGVGDEPQGIDFSKIDIDRSNPSKAIEQFKKGSDDYKKWANMVDQETEKLQKDLDRL